VANVWPVFVLLWASDYSLLLFLHLLNEHFFTGTFSSSKLTSPHLSDLPVNAVTDRCVGGF